MADPLEDEMLHEALHILGTTMGSLMEDAIPIVLAPPPKTRKGRLRVAADLSRLASDLAILSSAMGVLARQSRR